MKKLWQKETRSVEIRGAEKIRVKIHRRCENSQAVIIHKACKNLKDVKFIYLFFF